MSPEAIFTRKPGGLDYRVWLTGIVAIVLSIGMLGFRMSGNVQCHTVMITAKGPGDKQPDAFYAGEKISLQADMAKMKTAEWDFGDGSPKATGASVVHSFQNAGSYLVSATVNGKCTESVTVLIRAVAVVAPAAVADSTNPIFGSDAPVAGDSAHYTAAGAAQSYEWSVLNAPDFPVQTGPSVTYVFSVPGTRVIEVKLDNDPAKTYHKTITVLPRKKPAGAPSDAGANLPPPVIAPPIREDQNITPDAPKTMIVADDEFKDMLESVRDGSKDVGSFNSLLCSGAQTKVRANDDKTFVTLGELCEKIHDNKKYVIKSVRTTRDEKKCVILMNVRYKKKGLGVFGL